MWGFGQNDIFQSCRAQLNIDWASFKYLDLHVGIAAFPDIQGTDLILPNNGASKFNVGQWKPINKSNTLYQIDRWKFEDKI